jgi:hypothetical protein
VSGELAISVTLPEQIHQQLRLRHMANASISAVFFAFSFAADHDGEVQRKTSAPAACRSVTYHAAFGSGGGSGWAKAEEMNTLNSGNEWMKASRQHNRGPLRACKMVRRLGTHRASLNCMRAGRREPDPSPSAGASPVLKRVVRANPTRRAKRSGLSYSACNGW